MRDRLAILAESDVGRVARSASAGAPSGSTCSTRCESRAVVYFSLEADRRPLLAQMLGAAIVQDLQTTVAALQGRPVPTLVVIDEFSAIAAEQVARLFGRARSAGFSLLLGTQELSDLRLPGRERLLEQVHGQPVGADRPPPGRARLGRADREAGGHAGRLANLRSSSDGRTTRTRTREGVLEGDDSRASGTGWAAVITLVDGGECASRTSSPPSTVTDRKGRRVGGS